MRDGAILTVRSFAPLYLPSAVDTPSETLETIQIESGMRQDGIAMRMGSRSAQKDGIDEKQKQYSLPLEGGQLGLTKVMWHDRIDKFFWLVNANRRNERGQVEESVSVCTVLVEIDCLCRFFEQFAYQKHRPCGCQEMT